VIPADARSSKPAFHIEHKRPPQPLRFPVEETVPESKRHLKLRTLLYLILEHAFGDRACLGSDQFIYWNAANPRRQLAPDVFVRLGTPDVVFDSWKTWERGTPELAVEIVSDSDASEAELGDKLERYRELGVRELVRFEPDAAAGAKLRIWDRDAEDLVERKTEQDRSPSPALGVWWVVLPDAELGAVLRLAEDPNGERLLPTRAEAEALGRETERRGREAEARAREAEARAREVLERRVAELESQLRRRDE
jgi:Uma2 family endonuclease